MSKTRGEWEYDLAADTAFARIGLLWQETRQRPADMVFRGTLFLFAIALVVLLGAMVFEMLKASLGAISRYGPGFLLERTWDPVHEVFGAAPFIYGTIVSSVLALVLGVPLAIGVAVFLVEYAPRSIRQPLTFMVQILAAIPSVIYGLWGIFVLTPIVRDWIQIPLQNQLGWLPFFQGTPLGFGMLNASIILAIMIVPIISAVSQDVISAVPVSQREGALALGATKWESTLVVLQGARSGLIGAVILGLGRAVGETMAVTMLIGNRPEISVSLFAPSYTIAAVMANEFAESVTQIHKEVLIELALILFVLTFLINASARLLVWSVTRRLPGKKARRA